MDFHAGAESVYRVHFVLIERLDNREVSRGYRGWLTGDRAGKSSCSMPLRWRSRGRRPTRGLVRNWRGAVAWCGHVRCAQGPTRSDKRSFSPWRIASTDASSQDSGGRNDPEPYIWQLARRPSHAALFVIRPVAQRADSSMPRRRRW